MRTIYKFICILLLTNLINNCDVNGQSGENLYRISGIVADSTTKKALDFVTASLKHESGQSIKTTLSKTDGSFVFEKLKPGRYTVTVISVGYNAKIIPVDLNTAAHDLGIVTLSSQSYNLSEVRVTADRTIIKHETDRISYDMKADPESKGSTLLEIMRKVPLLSVDGDDNLLMSGNKSYKILINGKPSGMMERNAKDILRSMPASSIKNIEVIFSPSSKYDAEGVAGIINIITDRNVDNGYNGSVNATERFPLGGPAIGGSLTFKQGKLGVSALGGASQYTSPLTNTLNNRVTTGTNATNLIQNNNRESTANTGYFGAELSFEIDSLNLISGQFNLNKNVLSGEGQQLSQLTNSLGGVQGYSINNDISENGKAGDAALNYQLGFRSNRSRLLTLSYRYLGFDNRQLNNLNITDQSNYLIPDFRQSNIGRSTEQAVQIDYVHPIKKVNVEAGLKGIFRTNSSDFRYSEFNSGSGTFDDVAARSNAYDNRQDVFSAYNTYQFALKNWGFKAGVRLEQTVINAEFITTASTVKQNYLNVIPSVVISRKFKNNSSMSISYINRIQRPGITQLNPFVDRSNPDLESSGNPDLRPTLTNILLLSYNRSKKTTVSVNAAYMFFDGLIGPVSVYDAVNKITRTRFENMGAGNIVRSNLYINHPVNNKMNITFTTDIRYAWLKTRINNEMVDNNGLMAYLNVSTGYRFEKGWRVNANLTMNSANISGPQTKVNGYTNTSFSMNKDIIKDKLAFSAQVTNPFNKYRTNSERKFGPDFTQVNNNQVFYRSFGAGLNYRFGKLKEQIKKSKRSIVNDDAVEK